MNRIILTALTLTCLSCHKNEDNHLPKPDYFNEGLNEGINIGLASNYANDVGISEDSHVLAADDFETGGVQIVTEYDRYKENVTVVNNEPYLGTFSTKHSWPEGLNGPTCRFVIPDEARDSRAIFVRMYLRFDQSFHPGEGMEPVGVKGFGIYNEEGESGANTPCDGTNWYGVSCQFVGWGPSAKEDANDKYLWFGHMYSYNPYPEQAEAELGTIKVSSPGSGDKPYRFSIYSDPYKYIKFDKWYCYELGLFINTPGKYDGEARFWIDGVLQSRATNMRFRNIEELKPQYVHLNLHRTTENFPQTMIRYADNIVIATRYIGPVGN